VQNSRVLIVDDEADVVQALRLRLETAGYPALTASDGIEALKVLDQTSVDVILADLMLPHLDGLELTRRIRQDPRWMGTRVLLFSCNDDPAARGLALEFGAQDYLPKAIGGRAIVSRVLEVLLSANTSDVPRRQQMDYQQAELDLIQQLHAISENGDQAARLGEAAVVVRPRNSEPGGSASRAIEDLCNLAETLQRGEIAGVRRPQDTNP
jgi:DNA-binding response OmpR family regulator